MRVSTKNCEFKEFKTHNNQVRSYIRKYLKVNGGHLGR